MTLREWSEKQTVKVQRHQKFFNAFWVPDTNLVDRVGAFHLEDYAVSSVTGGSMWFVPRNPIAEKTT